MNFWSFLIIDNCFLEVQNSKFQWINSLFSGTVVLANLNSFITFTNCEILEISGKFGGVFHSHFASNLTFINTTFWSIFAVDGSLGSIDNDGMVIIDGGVFEDSFAYNIVGLTITESPLISWLSNMIVRNNYLLSLDQINQEIRFCIKLCFIDRNYLQNLWLLAIKSIDPYFIRHVFVKSSISSITITNLQFDNIESVFEGYYTEIYFNNCSFSNLRLKELAFKPIETKLNIQNCSFSNISTDLPISVFENWKGSITTINNTWFE